jgi:PhnB protein
MSQTKVKPIPDGLTAITPHLVCANASAAIEFYKKAFNAVEESRLAGPGGALWHAHIRIGGAALFLVDEMPPKGGHEAVLGPLALKGSPVTIHLSVIDVDASVAQAVAAGAKVTMPVMDMFWGDRYGQLEDPFDHKWSVATHKQDLTPEQIRQAMAQMK